MTGTQWGLVALGVVIACCILFVILQTLIGKHKAKSGKDKIRIAEVVKKAIPEGESYGVVYATFQWSDALLIARRRTTYYYYYAIAFRENTLFVIPLSFADGLVSYSQPIQLTPENIGKVSATNFDVLITDKAGKELVHFQVMDSYEIVDKFDHVNLDQKEEAKAFFAFMQTFADKVTP